MKIVYGKEYEEKVSQRIALRMLLTFANTFWLLSIILLTAGGTASGDTVACVIILIVYPVAIATWAIRERNRRKNS